MHIPGLRCEGSHQIKTWAIATFLAVCIIDHSQRLLVSVDFGLRLRIFSHDRHSLAERQEHSPIWPVLPIYGSGNV